MNEAPSLPKVGPVLLAGAVGHAIVSAIRDENPSAAVVDRGSYLRVSVAGRCRVTRAAIERELGGTFHWPADLEAVMASFVGRLDVSDTEASWSS